MPEPGNLQPVTVSRGISSPMDELATRSLLNSCLQGDTYKCPRCDLETKDPEEMINHLAEEINKSIQEVASLSTPTPKRGQEK
jgi:hypothetical protein